MAIVKKYPARVVSVRQWSDDLFTLGMVSLGTPFHFIPGQFLHFAFGEPDPTIPWPDSRCFSMQTPPGEEVLKITFSVKGDFTERMASTLREGSTVTLKMPYGSLFTQPHEIAGTIFVSGGTGITPFLSLFGHDSFLKYSNPVLYAGFRNIGHNHFAEELASAQQRHTGFSIRYFYENENGFIDPGMVAGKISRGTSCFISGPPQMIRSLKDGLILYGIEPAQIKTDEWE